MGELTDVQKLAITDGKAADTLAVSSSRTSSEVSHFVATRNVV